MSIRLTKVLLTAAVALYFTLVVVNNLTDYATNFEFVAHVLSMDTIFPDSRLHWRALPQPWVHHLFYGTIIAWEGLTAVLCGLGAYRLGRALSAEEAEFARARTLAVCGLLCGCLLWLLAFITVGGEWFAMWQSSQWNGQTPAFRMFSVMALVLLLVLQPERDGP